MKAPQRKVKGGRFDGAENGGKRLVILHCCGEGRKIFRVNDLLNTKIPTAKLKEACLTEEGDEEFVRWQMRTVGVGEREVAVYDYWMCP